MLTNKQKKIFEEKEILTEKEKSLLIQDFHERARNGEQVDKLLTFWLRALLGICILGLFLALI